MPETGQSLGVQDLRAIIHGLKMSGFAFIQDEEIKEQVSFLLGSLPSPENLDSLLESPQELKHVQEHVGEIMNLIEQGSRKDESFKVRYQAKTNMPPRYKVLKWRSAMGNSDLTKNLIKISVLADNNNEPAIAEKAIDLAKKAKTNNITQEDIGLFRAACKGTSLEKEAGFWGGVNNVVNEFGQAVKGVGQAVKGAFQLGNLKTTFEKINQDIDKALTYAQQAANANTDPQKKQQVANFVQQLSNMQMMGKEVYNIIDESDAPAQPAAPAVAAPIAEEPLTPQIAEGKGVNTYSPEAEQAAAPAAASKIDTMSKQDIWQLFNDPSKVQPYTLKSINEKGYNGKAIGELIDEEMRAMVKEYGLDAIAKSNKWVRVA